MSARAPTEPRALWEGQGEVLGHHWPGRVRRSPSAGRRGGGGGGRRSGGAVKDGAGRGRVAGGGGGARSRRWRRACENDGSFFTQHRPSAPAACSAATGWRAGGLAGWQAGGLAGWRAGGPRAWRPRDTAGLCGSVPPDEDLGTMGLLPPVAPGPRAARPPLYLCCAARAWRFRWFSTFFLIHGRPNGWYMVVCPEQTSAERSWRPSSHA